MNDQNQSKLDKQLEEKRNKFNESMTTLNELTSNGFDDAVKVTRKRTKVSGSFLKDVFDKKMAEIKEKAQEAIAEKVVSLIDKKIALEKELMAADEAFKKAKIASYDEYNKCLDDVMSYVDSKQNEVKQHEDIVNKITPAE